MKLPPKDLMSDIGLLILRLGIGGYMASHGWGKVEMLFSGGAAQFGSHLGLPPGLSLFLAAFAEFACAILVMIGLGTRFAAVPVVITMAVAAFVAHGSDPWSMTTAAKAFFSGASKSWASKEPALLFLIPFLALAFTGPGRMSLDHVFVRRFCARRQE